MSAPQQKPITLDFGFAFGSFAQQIAGERARRIEDARKSLTFGVDYLDRALGGIYPGDLILVGADTGVGKTELVSGIAQANARRAPFGRAKRVHGFFLEAEAGEIERRIKYRFLSDAIFDDRRRNLRTEADTDRLSYLDWHGGALEDLTGRYEDAADKILGDEYKNLFTCYKVRDFTGEDFEKAVLSIQNDTDLIILDHLHFVDVPDENENRGYKRIMKKIRDVQMSIRKPVIVVVHVRKPDGRITRAVPRLADIHGTSDIPKIATKAIMLARGGAPPIGRAWLRPTLFAVQKSRIEGARTYWTGLCMFNMRRNAYESDFAIGRLKTDKGVESFEHAKPEEWPAWALPGYKSIARRAADGEIGRTREPGED